SFSLVAFIDKFHYFADYTFLNFHKPGLDPGLYNTVLDPNLRSDLIFEPGTNLLKYLPGLNHIEHYYQDILIAVNY
ncbi:24307_t:CDS:1, partial [Gigaspora rosea]